MTLLVDGRPGAYPVLINRFYNVASDRVAAHAMTFVGRSLYNDDSEFGAECLARLQAFADKRIEHAKHNRDADHPEIAAMGWWFASSRFPKKWALDLLTTVITIAGRVEHEHLVMEELATVAKDFPAEAIAAIRLLAESPHRSWAFIGSQAEVAKILHAGLGSVQSDATRDLIHLLGALGYLEYRELLAQ